MRPVICGLISTMRAEVIWPVAAMVGATERGWAAAKLTATGGGDEPAEGVGAGGACGCGLQAQSSAVAITAAARQRQPEKHKENQ